ncbi:NADH dehydrogenase [ubiquinone] 1 subunit C2 [Diachasma alloeum]|uniref:NADH dehydrogenase [ubiquinone] 1 subunit C2 n=1 Tax=Diachasma alloeum TaxID=454923 RepID=A0A4E0S171_9HYME|nr:NADH dehydrogenase [ubiquinone] 1 subunit C2 [Diachasma alloeum]THK33130.1 B14.5B subunit, NADH-dehydrogenase [Diachasma alloeum]
MSDGKVNDVSWALKILEREPDYVESVWTRYFHQAWCTMFGVLIPVSGNFLYRRPVWAGIQTHITLGLIGLGVGTYLRQRERRILGERDAILRDYIIRHPEDFPPPERKKWGEVLVEWLPMR